MGTVPAMSDSAERFRRLAADFTSRAEAVPADAWDNPAPCEGWLAKDVVRHVVEWVPGFFSNLGFAPITAPDVDRDPAGAWAALRDAIQSRLDDPERRDEEFEMHRFGRLQFAAAIDQFVTPDVLVHTWDLARATGLDERLDPAEVHAFYEGISQADEELLRGSGQFGPRVDVPADADEQAKLLGWLGRQP